MLNPIPPFIKPAESSNSLYLINVLSSSFYFLFFFLLSLIPPFIKPPESSNSPSPYLFFCLFFFFGSFIKDLKLSTFHVKFSHLLFIFPLSLLLHLLFFLIWLKPNGCCSHKVQFLTFIPPKTQPHLTTLRLSLQNAVVEMGQHPYDFFSKFLCTIFLHLHLD